MKSFLFKETSLLPDADTLFEQIVHCSGSILLESGQVTEGLSRYSLMSAEPFMVITAKGNGMEITRENQTEKKDISQGDPLDIIAGFMEKYRIHDECASIPFLGGAAGYFSYDLGRHFETLPDIAEDDLDLPDCWLGFYDVAAVIDHIKEKVYIVSTGFPAQDPEQRFARAKERMRWLEKKISGEESKKRTDALQSFFSREGEKKRQDMVSSFDSRSYCLMVEKAKEYIAAGDIFQVNLSQRFQLSAKKNSWEVYKRLGKINPAPMAAYINCGFAQLVSASPERFMRVEQQRVETRPIKGTRPRGRTSSEDQQRREELWNSEKDRAELVMIVDLERNDLGKVCIPGTVKVPELYRLEEHPSVFHLVSTVQGTLEAGNDVFDLIRASFPGGSITGAPKKRAMEIIEELEPVRRGIYCGSMGYLSFHGDVDLNIVIRTLLFVEGGIYFQVGGGITIDSDPQAEYLETLDKAKALITALGLS